jgi:ABC-2 type transport system ATP-binding protein
VNSLPAAGPQPVPQRDVRVAVRGLSRAYDGVPAVTDISFTIDSGEVLGLLGPNGAGKTTIIEACAGLSRPDAGAVEICGLDMQSQASAARQGLGVVLQSTGLQDGITPVEAIHAFGAFYRKSVGVAELLQRFGLTAIANKRVAYLSGGERQRLFLALAFVNDPSVVLLDEPTAQLDPNMRHEFHEYIRAMKREGRALLLATHDMDEASALCDRLIVLNAGRIVAEGSPAELVSASATELRVQVQTAAPVDVEWLTGCGTIEVPASVAGGLQFTTTDLNQALAQLSKVLSARGVQITDLNAGRGRLEDLILKLTRANAGGPRT